MSVLLLVVSLAICVTLEKSMFIGIFFYTMMDIKPDKIFQHCFFFLEVKSFLQIKLNQQPPKIEQVKL